MVTCSRNPLLETNPFCLISCLTNSPVLYFQLKLFHQFPHFHFLPKDLLLFFLCPSFFTEQSFHIAIHSTCNILFFLNASSSQSFSFRCQSQNSFLMKFSAVSLNENKSSLNRTGCTSGQAPNTSFSLPRTFRTFTQLLFLLSP